MEVFGVSRCKVLRSCWSQQQRGTALTLVQREDYLAGYHSRHHPESNQLTSNPRYRFDDTSFILSGFPHHPPEELARYPDISTLRGKSTI